MRFAIALFGYQNLNHMEYRRLGKSGLQVSELSFGSWLTFGQQIDDATAEKLMHKAYDLGVNFFDNAEVYAQGKSELVMGKILNKANWPRDSYVVSSKAFWGIQGLKDSKPTQKGLTRKHLTEACHQALERLQVEYLDLYFCHRPDKETPIEETVWTMHNLITQGKILYWGTSEWSAQEIMEAHAVADRHHLIGPTMEQPQYNMFHREKVEVEFKQIYKGHGLGTTIWSPLASGILTGKYTTKSEPTEETRLNREGMEWLKERSLNEDRLQKIEQLLKLAQELDMTLPNLALAWCLNNPNVSTVITGASKLHHLEENLKASGMQDRITTEVEEKIEAILDNAPNHPDF